MPSVGTPEPGGLTYSQVSKVLNAIGQKKRIVGFDVVELAPIEGFVAPNLLAAKLSYDLVAASSLKL